MRSEATYSSVFVLFHFVARMTDLCVIMKEDEMINKENVCSETDIMRWKCYIPGKEGTIWQGGFFPLTMEFPSDYPAKPPKVSLSCEKHG